MSLSVNNKTTKNEEPSNWTMYNYASVSMQGYDECNRAQFRGHTWIPDTNFQGSKNVRTSSLSLDNELVELTYCTCLNPTVMDTMIKYRTITGNYVDSNRISDDI
jgi:hypothetical protein